jgi:hypothetical protein
MVAAIFQSFVGAPLRGHPLLRTATLTVALAAALPVTTADPHPGHGPLVVTIADLAYSPAQAKITEGDYVLQALADGLHRLPARAEGLHVPCLRSVGPRVLPRDAPPLLLRERGGLAAGWGLQLSEAPNVASELPASSGPSVASLTVASTINSGAS